MEVIAPKRAKAMKIVRLYALQKIETVIAISASEDESRFDRSKAKNDFSKDSNKSPVIEESKLSSPKNESPTWSPLI